VRAVDSEVFNHSVVEGFFVFGTGAATDSDVPSEVCAKLADVFFGPNN